MKKNKAYLLLGSNMGDSKAELEKAKQEIEKLIGRITAVSSEYRTAAWGKEDQPDFLNLALITETAMTASEVLEAALDIEKRSGRVRNEKYAARTIDIDIIFFNDDIISEEHLKVPHPYMQKRRFVLEPLNEIAASYTHPVLHKKIAELLAECDDPLNVQKI